MPNENAMPRNACGSAKKRLKYGYASVIASAGIDHRIVASLVVASTSTNAQSAKNAPRTSASHGAMTPLASGRFAVRFTCASNLRSTQSLKAQPAERISHVPITKTRISVYVGAPYAASHSAESVGHKSSSVPMGLSSRSSRSYASMRSCHESAVRVAAGSTEFESLTGDSSDRQRELACARPRARTREKRLWRRIRQPDAQLALHPRIDEAARFAHERQQKRSDALLGLLPRYARRTCQVVGIGEHVQPVTELELAVVDDVVRAIGRGVVQRGNHGARK